MSRLHPIPASVPSPQLRPRIAADMFGRAARVAPDVRRTREPLWERLGFWRFAAFAATAAALLLAFTLLLRPPTQPQAPAYIAVLEDPQNARAAGWLVEISADRSVRLVPLDPTQPGADHVLQFWTKAPTDAGPTSLGLVPADRATELSPERLASIVEGQLFEITLEPPGGSKIGRPTGPIRFKGLAVPVGGMD
jgi:anti-sigma-K factor RskA